MNNGLVPFDAERPEEYELRVRVGNPAAPDGLTRVALSGSGRLVAEQVFEDTPRRPQYEQEPEQEPTPDRRAEGEIPRAEAEHLLRMATMFPWERRFPSRPGIPDEARVIWQFVERGVTRATLEVWLREAENDPALAPVLEALRHNVAQLAHGEIYL